VSKQVRLHQVSNQLEELVEFHHALVDQLLNLGYLLSVFVAQLSQVHLVLVIGGNATLPLQDSFEHGEHSAEKSAGFANLTNGRLFFVKILRIFEQ